MKKDTDQEPKDGGFYTGVCGVWVCNNNNKFACDNNMCGNSSLVFTVNGGTIQQNAAFSDVLATTATSAATSTSTTSSTTSQVQTPSSVATCGSAADSGTSASSSCPSNVGTYAGIGAGLGVPLLVALVALAFMFMQLRKHKMQHRVLGAEMPSKEQQYVQPLPPLSQNSYGGGYYSPAQTYKPPTQPGELPTASGDERRTELDGITSQK